MNGQCSADNGTGEQVKLVSIVGVPPHFIKAAAERHREFLVHTGQHYDYEMLGILLEAEHSFAPNGSHPILCGDGFAAAKCVALLN